jgi:hypothetical protein
VVNYSQQVPTPAGFSPILTGERDVFEQLNRWQPSSWRGQTWTPYVEIFGLEVVLPGYSRIPTMLTSLDIDFLSNKPLERGGKSSVFIVDWEM